MHKKKKNADWIHFYSGFLWSLPEVDHVS